MNAYLILVALLVLAYAGSALFRGRRIQGYGLPSGTEYLVLGVAVGPIGLDSLTRGALATFEPIAVAALSWIALLAGSGLGYVGATRIPVRRTFASIAIGGLCMAATGGAAWLAAPWVLGLGGIERVYVAVGVGCTCCETTRAAVRWVAERHAARGPLSDLVSDLSEADDTVPLLGLAVLFAIGPTPEGAVVALPSWVGMLATLALGAVLGATASALADVETRTTERWGVLLGTALLATGVAMRLGLSAPSAMFVMGITLNVLSRHGRELRAMLASTERPIMMPALVLAGAHLDLADGSGAWALVGVAMAARILAKAAAGLVVAQVSPAAQKSSPLLGLAMLSSGALTACVGLATALRFPGTVGRVVLASSVASCVVGELLGPAMLKRELHGAGEVSDQATRTPVPVQVPAAAAAVARRGRGGIVAARARSRATHPSHGSHPSHPDRGSLPDRAGSGSAERGSAPDRPSVPGGDDRGSRA